MDQGTIYMSTVNQTTSNMLALSSASILNNATLLDPVSKLRICQPQSLIDTDFEYGLQHSKWETIELINNIPTFFSRNGDEPIPLVSMTAEENSDLVTVVTANPHHFVEGYPFIVQGSESSTADGAFLVYCVTSPTTFVYKAKDVQTARDLYDPYSTLLFAGRVYQSTMFHHECLQSIKTDGASPHSTLTVKTTHPHGLEVTTAMSLCGASGKKVVTFDGAQGVGYEEFISVTSSNISSSNKLPGVDTNTWMSYPIVPHNWIGKYQVHFESADVDVEYNTIAIPNHGLTSNDTVMYVPAVDPNEPVGGLVPYTIYKVQPANPNLIQLKPYVVSSPTSGLSYFRYGAYFNDNMSFFRSQNHVAQGIVTNMDTIAAFQGLSTSSTNYSIDVLGYFKPSSSGTWTFTITSDDASYLWIGKGALLPQSQNALISNANVREGVVSQTAMIFLSSNTYYPIRIYHGATSTGAADFSMSFSGPGVSSRTDGSSFFFHHEDMSWDDVSIGSVADITSSGTSIGQSHTLIKAYPIRSADATLDSCDVDVNTGNSANTGIPFNQSFYIFSGDSVHGKGFGLNDFLPTTSQYNASTATEYIHSYVVSRPVTVGATSTTVHLNTAANGAALNIRRAGTHGLSWLVPSAPFTHQSSFAWHNHGLSNSQPLAYTKKSGVGPSVVINKQIQELPEGMYYAEVRDRDWIRLKTSADGPTLDVVGIGKGTYQFFKSVLNENKNRITSPFHGLIRGQRVVYMSYSNMDVPGLSNNATYMVTDVTRDTFRLASLNSASNIQSLTGVSSGTHKLGVVSVKADSSFEVTELVDSTTFKMSSPFEILPTDLLFEPRKSVTRDNGAYWYIENHGLVDGNEVSYHTNGNPCIGGLVDGGTYYVVRSDNNAFRLSTALDDTNSVIINYTFPENEMGSHTLRVHDMRSATLLSYKAAISSGANVISCADVDFLANYRNHDMVLVEVPELQHVGIQDIDVTTHVLTLERDPGFYPGTYVQYSNQGDSDLSCINGLEYGTNYYVGIPSAGMVTLHTSYADAMAGINPVAIEGESVGGFLSSHEQAVPLLVDTNSGIITLTNIRSSITGGHQWSHGDYVVYETTGVPIDGLSHGHIYAIGRDGLGDNEILLFETKEDADLNINPIVPSMDDVTGIFRRLTRRTVYTPRIVEIHSSADVSTNIVFSHTTEYAKLYGFTSLYPRVDGLSLHRPYDGGVEMIPSSCPGAQLIRQTRRYFRYQSGKGMQMAKAVNFNAPVDIQEMTRIGAIAYITTRSRHRVTPGLEIEIVDASEPEWNGTYLVSNIVNSRTFAVQMSVIPTVARAGGYPRFKVKQWTGSSLRVGLFDDQNGLFFEYDGSGLYAVRRNSVKQLPGTVGVTFNDTTVRGTGTRFLTQLAVGDKVVIKGMTYKVTEILDDVTLSVNPRYRGVTNENIIMTKTQDVRVQQSQWSIDPCDGTGPSGYQLDISKIQMLYIDYSWYGAGKARFGFKALTGELIFCHEFIHNNVQTEAYLRTGNVASRYEVENTGIPTYVPALMHWGSSVIMDGGFDADSNYVYTASGKSITYAAGDVSWISGCSFTNYGRDGTKTISPPYSVLHPMQGEYVDAYRLTFSSYNSIRNIRPGTVLQSPNILSPDTKVVMVTAGGMYGYIYVDKPPLIPEASIQVVYAGNQVGDQLPLLVPLVSIRLAPSVDNNRTGSMGSREIINRMQIQMKNVSVLTTHDVEIKVILNGHPYHKTWTRTQASSLSQLILHDKGETIQGGTQIFSFRAPGGSVDAAGTKVTQHTSVDMKDVTTLGNSVLGGDDVFPNGPDVLTVCATLLDTSGITTATPFTITGRLTWTESQA